MKYVQDASVAAFWVVRSPLTPRALRLRSDYQQRIHKLIAPSHFPAEIASALTKAERTKVIRCGAPHPLIGDVLTTPPVLYVSHCNPRSTHAPGTPQVHSHDRRQHRRRPHGCRLHQRR
jgi:hypothetical protein